jgi:putative hemolysin
MGSHEIIYIILFIICVSISAFFSVVEIAFISLQRFKLEHLIEKKVEGANLVATLISRPERLLSTIILGNNFVNTSAAALATAVAVHLWGPTGTLYSIVGVTIILMVFGDTIPKTSGAHHAEALAIKLAKTVRALSWVFSPIVAVLSWIAVGFGKLFGSHAVGGSLVSAEEIRAMINVGHRDGSVATQEAEMLHKVFEFGDRPAREIMVPRTEIIWVEKGTPMTEFFKIYIERPMNRYPVFEGRRDNAVGIVSSKDILMGLAKGTCDIERSVDEFIRPAFFAPESKRISELLSEMRDQTYHMCLIVDEYGGVAGLVTLTALIEEIVGDVRDELATVEKDFEIIDDYTFQIDGGMRIQDINNEMRLDLPLGDYDTAAGFVLRLLGHIPKTGEQLRYKDLKVTVTRMSGLKIEEILIAKEKNAATTDKIQPRT